MRTNHQNSCMHGSISTVFGLNIQRLIEGIPGEPANPLHPVSACNFHPRCRYAKAICSHKEPQLIEVEPGHSVSCLRIDTVRRPYKKQKQKRRSFKERSSKNCPLEKTNNLL
ncbi:MAG: hypothetical protein JSV85_01700 [Candidatus Bathyarchaeota archaeon]|nr:MAG: hypothetical protein JSV85_01700 [Candidatus Bathyarchaeota archaeon]